MLVPLGTCCVASAARAAGHQVRLLDLCFERHPDRALEETARRLRPDVVGVSIRNLDNSDYESPRSYLPDLQQMIKACRSAWNAQVVIGGPAVSHAPSAVARRLDVSIAVSGEGEMSFPAILSAMETGADVSTLAGVTALRDDRVVQVEPAPVTDLAGLPDPEPWRWLDLRRYCSYDAALPVQTKRGCAFRCSYCCYPLLEGRSWRLREPGWVAEQVDSGRAAGFRAVDFVDSVFGVPEAHAAACCEAIARRSPDLHLTTLELNPLGCVPEVIDAMNGAGFSAVGVTVESGSDEMLDRLCKGFGTADLHRAAEALRKLDAQKLWIFMIGAPGETEATVAQTARFIEQLPHSDLVLVTHGIRVLPGTALRDSLVAEGFVQPDDELIDPVFYYSPHLSLQRARDILSDIAFPSANMVTLTDSGHRLAPVVQRVATLLGARPPYWRHIPLINRARRLLRV